MRVAVSFLGKETEMTAENIIKKLPRLEAAGVNTIQWDLMDGVYNPNNTVRWFSPDVMEKVMSKTKMGSEAHMMVIEPWNFVNKIKDYCSMFIFHLESCKSNDDVLKTIDKTKSFGKVGIAIEPETKVEELYDYLHLIDLILVMTVKTGHAGQPFIDMSDKIRKLVKERELKKLSFEIEVDGGINDKTIETVRTAGCDAVNSASFILNNDYKDAVRTLKG